MLRILRPLIAAVALDVSAPAFADPLRDAEYAYEMQEYDKALQLWTPLADDGNAQAQFGLGALFAFGRKDEAEGLKWSRRAADQGYPRAEHYMAFLYGVGLHVPQDYVLSYMWDNLAAAQDEKGARLSRDNLAAKMTPEQIAEAQRLSREWKPTVWKRTDSSN